MLEIVRICGLKKMRDGGMGWKRMILTLSSTPDQPLNGISLVVDDKYHSLALCLDHGANLLNCQCHGSVASNQYRPSLVTLVRRL